jgi:hypothetical protein
MSQEAKTPLPVPGSTAIVRAGKQRARRFNAKRPKKPRATRGRQLGNVSLSDAASMAKSAWNATKYIMRLINVEEKFFDVTAILNADYSGSVVNLSNIAQGTDVSQRDGDSILAQKLTFRGFVIPGATAAKNFLRMIIFRDMQQDGVDPTPAQVLEVTGSSTAISSPISYFGAYGKNRHRYQILLDRTYMAALATERSQLFDEWSHTFSQGSHILYDATAGADASNREGALFMLLISDNTGVGNTPGFNYYFRLTFTDN